MQKKHFISLMVIVATLILAPSAVFANALDSQLYYQDQLHLVNEKISNLPSQDRTKRLELEKEKNHAASRLAAYNKVVELQGTVDQEDLSFLRKGQANTDLIQADLIDVVAVGTTYINNSVYAFGGGRNEIDIAFGRFDCSSYVHWAFDQVGIDLGARTSVTTDTLKHLGETVSIDDVQPGDLVFFDTYKIDGHVGIYSGNGKFIGAQGSTGVAFADMSEGYWKEKFNGRVKRID